jgi:hypothetical protein
MNKRKLFPFLVLGVLLALSLACGVTTAAPPTATPQPTYTPYPTYTPQPTLKPIDTAVPPTEEPKKLPVADPATIIGVLLDNGFVRYSKGDSSCPTSCKTYLLANPYMVAQVYDANGALALALPFSGGKTSQTRILDKILGALYPQEIIQWIDEHMDSALSSQQAIRMDSFDVLLMCSSGYLAVVIAPL